MAIETDGSTSVESVVIWCLTIGRVSEKETLHVNVTCPLVFRGRKVVLMFFAVREGIAISFLRCEDSL